METKTDKTSETPKPDVKKAEADRKQAEKGKSFTRPGTEKRG